MDRRLGRVVIAGNWSNGVPTASTVACFPDTGTSYTVGIYGPATAKGLEVGQSAAEYLLTNIPTSPATLTLGSAGLNAGPSS